MRNISFGHGRVNIRLPRASYKRGWFFVTICTQGRQKFFGHMDSGSVRLNALGQYVEKLWNQVPFVYCGVRVDEYVVMPEHVHAIVILDEGAATTLPNLLSQLKGLAAKAAPELIGIDGRAVWQRRFYDRYIRGQGVDKIRAYIARHRERRVIIPRPASFPCTPPSRAYGPAYMSPRTPLSHVHPPHGPPGP